MAVMLMLVHGTGHPSREHDFQQDAISALGSHPDLPFAPEQRLTVNRPQWLPRFAICGIGGLARITCWFRCRSFHVPSPPVPPMGVYLIASVRSTLAWVTASTS